MISTAAVNCQNPLENRAKPSIFSTGFQTAISRMVSRFPFVFHNFPALYYGF